MFLDSTKFYSQNSIYRELQEISGTPYSNCPYYQEHASAEQPVCHTSIPRLYEMLYDCRNHDRYCSVTTRLDEHEMKGMRREDAGNYLNMVASTENLKFTYIAQQALIRIVLCTNMGGIHAFTTIIGRYITVARVKYYTAPGRSFPDYTRCIRPAIPEGKAYPGAELILTPPATPEPILIDEGLVEGLLGEYKSHFPKVTVSKED